MTKLTGLEEGIEVGGQCKSTIPRLSCIMRNSVENRRRKPNANALFILWNLRKPNESVNWCLVEVPPTLITFSVKSKSIQSQIGS